MITAGNELILRLGSKEWLLEPHRSVTLGRDVKCTIVIEHELVSRVHATIRYEDGWAIQDNNSTNGLYVNGSRVKTFALEPGTRVRLGDPVEGPELDLLPTPDSDRVIEHTMLAGAVPQLYRAIPKQLMPVDASATTIAIGTAPDNDIVVHDLFASRHHARLTEVTGGMLVEDLNSLNGTYLNGQLISSGYLRDGDILTVGHSDFVRSRGAIVAASQVKKNSGGLDVHGLGFTLPSGKRLLHDIDLTARRGTLTAVIGPSGAGKSTLSRVLTGLTTPTAGGVRFDGFDVHASYELVRTRIGLVPQEDVLHRQLTVDRALGFAATLRLPADADLSVRQQQVARVVSELELGNHTKTRIDKLSGGQRKRASVALELLTEPSMLVLDEPTSGLDPSLDRQVMQTLRTLADGDRAVIVITHSVAYLDLCDQVLVLAPGGMPAYLGPASGIQNHFGTADWAEIFGGIAADPQAAHAAFRRATPAGGRREAQLPLADGAVERSAPGTPWLRQFRTLAARQSRLVLADAGYLTFLVLLPFVLGLLALVVPGHAGFTTPALKTMGEPSQLLALMIVGASFMGSSISIRDLVSERPIFLRERAVGLSPSAYLASKIFVFGLFAWLSSVVLVVIVLIGKKAPTTGIAFASGSFDLFLAVGLTASCCVVLGLLVSSLVRSNEQAMPVLIVLLMAQLVLHGGIIPVTGRPVLDQLSWLFPARWGFGAAASSINLEQLVPSLTHDWLWGHSLKHWVFDVCILLAFAVIFAFLTFLRVRNSRKSSL